MNTQFSLEKFCEVKSGQCRNSQLVKMQTISLCGLFSHK